MNKRPRVVVFAYSEVGFRCLRALVNSGANIKAVFTYNDSKTENVWFGSVANLAEENRIPVFKPKGVGKPGEIKLIRGLEPEILFSFYYRDIIPGEILQIPRLGAFNMHGSLLPKYRGRACVNWAIIHGETQTGPTLHYMTKRPDEGDIVARKIVPIAFTDTAKDVTLKVADAAESIVAETLPLIERGVAPRVPQNHSEATYFGGRGPEDGRINWSDSAIEIYNLIRAVTHPLPGAFTTFNDRRIFIWWAAPLETKTDSPPGTVVSLEPFTIATGKGLLRIESWQIDGESEEAAVSLARGFLQAGDIL
ncbi:MAG: formyltransferase [Synergistota bacterium]|nr:formyltransferase [Synergistota bacterium]